MDWIHVEKWIFRSKQYLYFLWGLLSTISSGFSGIIPSKKVSKTTRVELKTHLHLVSELIMCKCMHILPQTSSQLLLSHAQEQSDFSYSFLMCQVINGN